MPKPTKEELRDREAAIVASPYYQTDEERIAGIAADREQRWAAHLLAMGTVPGWVTAWQANMAVRYGTTVRVWGQRLDWITAWFVVSFGQAEYHWPESWAGLQETFEGRLVDWWRGKNTPVGIEYI